MKSPVTKFILTLSSTVFFVSIRCMASGFDHFSKGFFVNEIFSKYGNSNVITYEGFEHLLENLGLGKLKFETNHDVSMHKVNGTFMEFHDELSLHRHNHEPFELDNSTEGERRKRSLNLHERDAVKIIRQICLTPQDILIAFDLQPHHDLVISPEKYLQLCPAIIYELDQKLCQDDESLSSDETKRKENHLVWMYASASILVMGLSGVLCILVMPVIGGDTESLILRFLVSLAAGTLCGDALIHSLPQVFSELDDTKLKLTPIFKGTSALVAIYLFFILECAIIKFKIQKKKVRKIGELTTMLSNNDVEKSHCLGHSHQNGDIKSVAWMTILGDVLHNLTDGLAIGAAFTLRLSAGFASSIAIFCHELPHELGDYAILLASGMSIKKTLFYNVLSTVFSLLGMVSGILLGEYKNASLWINAITAGSFLYVALTDLFPVMKTMKPGLNYKIFLVQIFGVFCGGTLMFCIALYEDQIEAILY